MPLPVPELRLPGLAMLLRRLAPGSLRRFPASIWVPPLVGIAAWLVSAPSFRFGFAVMWIFAAQAACAATWYLDGRTWRATWAGLCLMAALPILQLVHLRVQDHQTIPSAIRDTIRAPRIGSRASPLPQSLSDEPCHQEWASLCHAEQTLLTRRQHRLAGLRYLGCAASRNLLSV